MVIRSRKLYIWIIGFGVVFFAYLVCSRIGGTGRLRKVPRPSSAVFTSEGEDVGQVTGQLGPAKVGQVKTARFVSRDREWGFDKLLNPEEGGDEWELEKPYMKIFKPRFRCDITADKGFVQVEETVPSKVSPKEALLTGNVRVHIPGDKSRGVKEGVLLLDDVIFVSEKSHFSTAGPVKFVSQDAEMVGRGMEAVYNEGLDRLELLRIVDLEFLHLKGSSVSSPVEEASGETAKGTQSQSPEAVKADAGDGEREEETKEQGPLYYQCVLDNNVVVEYGERMTIFADVFCVNNILWRRGSDSEKEGTVPGGSKTTGVEKAASEGSFAGAEVQESEGPLEASEDSVDIVITCDGSITVIPMGSGEGPVISPAVDANLRAGQGYGSDESHPGAGEETAGGNILRTKRIDYDMLSGKAIARRNVEFSFYRDVLSSEGSDKKRIPVKITADKRAVFMRDSEQVVFEGNVVGTMVEDRAEYTEESKLYGEKLIVTLEKEAGEATTKRQEMAGGSIRQVTVTEGVVKLESVRKVEGKLFSGINLKCRQLDYDAAAEEVVAIGPGVIKVDNSRAERPRENLGRFSMRRPCWALIENFEKLWWFMQSDIVVAEGKSQGMHISYLPLVDGQFGQVVSIDTSQVEARYAEMGDGQAELAELSAKGGIIYQEKDKQFEGRELFFDASKSMLTVQGQPCYFNGTPFGEIEYNLETGAVKTELVGTGAVLMEAVE